MTYTYIFTSVHLMLTSHIFQQLPPDDPLLPTFTSFLVLNLCSCGYPCKHPIYVYSQVHLSGGGRSRFCMEIAILFFT